VVNIREGFKELQKVT